MVATPEKKKKKSSLRSQLSATLQSSDGSHNGSRCDRSPLDGGLDDRRRGWCGAGVIPSEYVVPVRVRSRRAIPVWLCARRWLLLRGSKTPVMAVYRKAGERLALDADVSATAPLRVMALGSHTRVRAVGEKTLEVAAIRAPSQRSDTWVLTFDSSAQRRRVYELVAAWAELGAFLQQLTAVELVARSHNSSVYKCRSRAEDRSGRGHSSSTSRFALKRVSAERCASELAITARVASIPELRPFLARYLVMFEDANSPGSVTIVMKYYRGGSLGERLRATGPMDERAARGVLSALCCALLQLHVHGVLHLDIKAANVLFDGDASSLRDLKLVDFGSSILVHDDEEESDEEHVPMEKRRLDRKVTTARAAGTVGCMAPERFDGRVGPESDVYGAGVVLYHMIEGDVPFRGRDSRQVLARNMRGDVSFTSERWRQASPRLRALAERMLHKDPDARVTLPEILSMTWLFQQAPPPAARQNHHARAMFA